MFFFYRLIEEFMLLANQSVAEFIHRKYPEIALLRRHPPPKEEMISRQVEFRKLYCNTFHRGLWLRRSFTRHALFSI